MFCLRMWTERALSCVGWWLWSDDDNDDDDLIWEDLFYG